MLLYLALECGEWTETGGGARSHHSHLRPPAVPPRRLRSRPTLYVAPCVCRLILSLCACPLNPCPNHTLATAGRLAKSECARALSAAVLWQIFCARALYYLSFLCEAAFSMLSSVARHAARAPSAAAAAARGAAARALSGASAPAAGAAGAPASLPPPVRAGESPAPHETKVGDAYSYCTCGLSQKQPLCDGRHKGTGYRPLRIKAAAAETVWLCTCKATGNADTGRCDGSHLKARPVGGPAPVQAVKATS